MTPISPMMIDFPDRFETERLLLRLPLPGDGFEVYQAMQESIDELKPWLIWANREQSSSDMEAFIRQCHVHFLERTDLRFHGYFKETGELAFCGGFHQIDWDLRKFEFGYWLRTKYAGKGLATEAARGLEYFAIESLGANRIEIRCDISNVKSAGVAKRLGYSLEGVLRSQQWDSTMTTLRDFMLFAKVRGIEF